jgi:hypothetical protein
VAYYGRFRHSELPPLLARINRRVQEWIRGKYRRLRAYKVMKRGRDRITGQGVASQRGGGGMDQATGAEFALLASSR